MREFVKRRSGSIQLLDCRGITPTGYNALASTTQPRHGWEGYAARPFQYDSIGGTVLKTFWSWKRVGVPPSWRAAREQDHTLEPVLRPQAVRRRSWFRDDEFDDRGCTIM
jgi:F-box/leucine-rich repeat protein 2/20